MISLYRFQTKVWTTWCIWPVSREGPWDHGFCGVIRRSVPFTSVTACSSTELKTYNYPDPDETLHLYWIDINLNVTAQFFRVWLLLYVIWCDDPPYPWIYLTIVWDDMFIFIDCFFFTFPFNFKKSFVNDWQLPINRKKTPIRWRGGCCW